MSCSDVDVVVCKNKNDQHPFGATALALLSNEECFHAFSYCMNLFVCSRILIITSKITQLFLLQYTPCVEFE